ncbi:MAG: hypothetical protein KDD47_26645, partial [Acidobacteria bacterium]|nr:hypothetical protein [Acidobacteriota bacterium]
MSALLEDSRGHLLVGTRWNGVFLQASEEESLEPLPLPPSLEGLRTAWVSSLAEDSDGGVWIATLGRGLFRWNPDSGDLWSYRSSPRARGSLEGDSLRSLLVDRDGQLWCGTEQAGLAYLPRIRRLLGQVRDLRPPGGETSLQAVFSLLIDDTGTVWAGTLDQGLLAFEPRTGRARTFLNEKGSSGRPLAGRVYALAAGRPGEVLAGTSDGRLFSFRGLDGPSRELAYLSGPEGALSLRALVADREGHIWAATWQGRLLHLPPGGTWSRLPLQGGEDGDASKDPLISLFRDRQGQLWAGTWSSGLLQIDPAAGRWRRHLDSVDGSPLRVAAVRESAQGRLWVATDRGVFVSSGTLPSFQPVEALGHGPFFSLEEDDRGDLWAAGNGGLWRYSPRSGELRLFQHRHGLQSNEFNVGASARGPGGALAFGGLRGFNLFRPDEIPEPRPPSVALVRLRAGRRILVGAGGPLRLGGPVRLPPTQRSVTFDAAVLDYL